MKNFDSELTSDSINDYKWDYIDDNWGIRSNHNYPNITIPYADQETYVTTGTDGTENNITQERQIRNLKKEIEILKTLNNSLKGKVLEKEKKIISMEKKIKKLLTKVKNNITVISEIEM